MSSRNYNRFGATQAILVKPSDRLAWLEGIGITSNKMKTNKLLSSDVLWPDALSEKLFSGFSNEELEHICDWGLRGYDKKLPYKPAHWIYWPAELYSFGRCYRDWLGLPSWAPLPIYGDHGVALSGILSPHEIKAKPKVFITWFKDRAESLAKEKQKKDILHIPHPWIPFRKKYKIEKLPDAKGTLVFYSHTNTGIEIVEYDWDQYFSGLKNLPDEYHPLIICMHRHDVEKGYHRHIRKYGLPIISAGETSSPYFVERFYDIVSKFAFATSNSGGSEVFYCEELGLSYFIFGEPPKYFNFSSSELPIGKMIPRDTVSIKSNELKNELFRQFPPKKSKEKDDFVNRVLGVDMNLEKNKKTLKQLYYREILRHAHSVAINLFITILKNLWSSYGIKSKLFFNK